MVIDRIREVAGIMREVGARRVKVEGLEIELGPLPATGEEKLEPSAEGICECGHVYADHNEHGCMVAACSPTICNRSAPKDAELAP